MSSSSTETFSSPSNRDKANKTYYKGDSTFTRLHMKIQLPIIRNDVPRKVSWSVPDGKYYDESKSDQAKKNPQNQQQSTPTTD